VNSGLFDRTRILIDLVERDHATCNAGTVVIKGVDGSRC
jgi:hypothetical protein